MIVGIDTDVLVNWLMVGAVHHHPADEFIRETVANGNKLGVTPQTLHEVIHICTDARRFETPLSMNDAIAYTRKLWDGKEVARLLPTVAVLHRTLELLSVHALGRKRILDTALAATLEAADVLRLATFNAKHFEVFGFLEIVVPDAA